MTPRLTRRASTRRRLVATCLTSAVALGATAAAPAAAAGPDFDRETISFQFEDEELAAECGLEGAVTVTGAGKATNRTFEDTGRQGVRFVRSVNVALTLTYGDRSVTIRDVGADVERVTPDGRRLLQIMGQLPLWFTGRILIDPDTDEVLAGPSNPTDATRVCRALTR